MVPNCTDLRQEGGEVQAGTIFKKPKPFLNYELML